MLLRCGAARCEPQAGSIVSALQPRVSWQHEESGLRFRIGGEPLIPVQPITSIVFGLAGLIGLGTFLAGHFRLAAIVPAVATWGWRAVSETLRADYRGASRISAYQVMAFIAVSYLMLVLCLVPSEGPLPNLLAGLTQATSTWWSYFCKRVGFRYSCYTAVAE